MSSDDQTAGQQQRPERSPSMPNDEIEEERAASHEPLSNITMRPGRRRTDSVELLVIEAELVAEGKELDNPATPRTEHVGKSFFDRIEDTDLVPAWTRPWEVDDDE